MERRKFLTLVGLGAIPLAGCTGDDPPDSGSDDASGSDDTDTTTNDDSGSDDADSSDDEQDDEESKSASVPVGEKVEGDNLSMVAQSVTRDTKIGEYQEADSGNEFVVIKLAVKNTTDSDFLNFSGFLSTQLKDDEDYTYDPTIAVTGNTFQGGQLAPGEVSRGDVVFEVPQDASNLVLQFDFTALDFFNFDRVTVNLGESADTIAELDQSLNVPIHSPGESVTYGDVTVTANSVEYKDSLGSFAEADEGHEYAIIDITTTNDTDEELQLSTLLQMKCKDGAGNSHNMSITALTELDKPYNESQPLASGESRRGKVPYQVPKDAKSLFWTFEFTLWTDGDKTFWKLR